MFYLLIYVNYFFSSNLYLLINYSEITILSFGSQMKLDSYRV